MKSSYDKAGAIDKATIYPDIRVDGMDGRLDVLARYFIGAFEEI